MIVEYKTELLELVTKILKEERAGVKLSWTENKDTKRLKHLLLKTDKWKNAVSKSTMMKIMYRMTKGRRYKSLNIMVGNRLIPVTKSAIKKIGAEESKRTLVIRELRYLIEPQIKEEKTRQIELLERKQFGKINPVKYHLDHVVPFIKLACDWVVKLGYKDFDDLPGRKYRSDWRFPPDIAESWISYHKELADLDLVPAEINLAEKAKGYNAAF